MNFYYEVFFSIFLAIQCSIDVGSGCEISFYIISDYFPNCDGDGDVVV